MSTSTLHNRDHYRDLARAVRNLALEAEVVLRDGTAHEAEKLIRVARRLRQDLGSLQGSELLRWLENLERDLRRVQPTFASFTMTCRA